MNHRSSSLPLALAAALLVGCGTAAYEDAVPDVAVVRQDALNNEAPGAKAAPDAVGEQDAGSVPRRIIYTAAVELMVKDFGDTDRKIQTLTQEFGGFIAEFREDRTYGDRRAGRWVVRTPVRRFQEFLDAIVALGVPETRRIDAQDVTEEFLDLEARLANKRKLEERILALLEEQTGEIKDVIAVETELARVREEIERMEGRLRFLANRVELTTITITAREDVDYVPPQAPTFAGKVQTTWTHSLAAMRTAGEGLALFVVAIFPWLAVLAILAAPLAIWAARFARRRRAIDLDEVLEHPL